MRQRIKTAGQTKWKLCPRRLDVPQKQLDSIPPLQFYFIQAASDFVEVNDYLTPMDEYQGKSMKFCIHVPHVRDWRVFPYFLQGESLKEVIESWQTNNLQCLPGVSNKVFTSSLLRPSQRKSTALLSIWAKRRKKKMEEIFQNAFEKQ